MRARRLAITGANGFVGRHVCDIAKRRGHQVTALVRNASVRWDDSDLSPDEVLPFDLRTERPDFTDVDAIVHLAGLAAVGPSFDDPMRYIHDNSSMLVNIGESLLDGRQGHTRLVVVSTGAVYNPTGQPQSEDSELGASSPYAISKRTVEELAMYYRSRGLDVVVARPFNHIGPGQKPGFIVPDLYRKISVLREGEKLKTGNLASARDYTDVRDVARAYISLVEASSIQSPLYNVASGVALTGSQILAMLCDALGRPVPETEASALRPSDASSIVGDATRLALEIGWSAEFSIEQSVRDFVEHEREAA